MARINVESRSGQMQYKKYMHERNCVCNQTAEKPLHEEESHAVRIYHLAPQSTRGTGKSCSSHQATSRPRALETSQIRSPMHAAGPSQYESASVCPMLEL